MVPSIGIFFLFFSEHGKCFDLSGTIRIVRTSKRDIKMRDLYVKVDGGDEQTLQFGQSVEIQVTAGMHTVTVTNRLYTKKLEVKLADGETVVFEAGNVTGKLMGTAIMVFGVGPYKVDIRRLN